jgi:hypothetical protein
MAHNTPKTRSTVAAQPMRPAQRTIPITRSSRIMRSSGLITSAGRAFNVILPMIAALLLLAAAPRVGWGQCPGSSGPSPSPTACPWMGPVSDTLNMQGGCRIPYDSGCDNPGCVLIITYCYRCCATGSQVYLEGVNPGNEYCDSVYPLVMINFAQSYADTAGLRFCPLPPCGHGATQPVSFFTPTCWTESGLAGEYEFLPCSDAGCYCETDCVACRNEATGEVTLTGCTTTLHGTCTCTSLAGDPPWVAGTCYTIPCE